MGEAREWLFEPSFNRAVKVCATDDRITSDAGLILLREADHRLGLTTALTTASSSLRFETPNHSRGYNAAGFRRRFETPRFAVATDGAHRFQCRLSWLAQTGTTTMSLDADNKAPDDWAAVLNAAVELYHQAEAIRGLTCQIRDFFPSSAGTIFNVRQPSLEFQRGDTRSLVRRCTYLKTRLDALQPQLRQFVSNTDLDDPPDDDDGLLRYYVGVYLLRGAGLDKARAAADKILVAARADKKAGRLVALNNDGVRWDAEEVASEISVGVQQVAKIWCVAPMLAPKVPRRGRRQEDSPEEQRVYDAWRTGQYASTEELAREFSPLKPKEAKRIIEKFQKRAERERRRKEV
jgi:hypothetical protein